MAISSAFLVFLATLSFQETAFAAEYIVWPESSVGCCDTCYTLNAYAANPSVYFTSGSNFSLLRGEHHLNTSLIFDSVASVSLSGDDIGSTTISVAPGASIIWNNSLDISISHLAFIYEGSTAASSHTAMIFEDSTSVRISDVKFVGVNTVQNYSQAIRLTQTVAAFADCHFSNWHSTMHGGAMFTNASSIVFSGATTFENNTSDRSGGGIYVGNGSTIVFRGNNSFLNNNARFGGGVYGESSDLEFSGNSIFERNQPINENVELIGSSMYILKTELRILNAAEFRKNSGKYSGAIESLESNIFMNGQMAFSDNILGGTIYLFRSNFTCLGETIFSNNNASSAGSCMYISKSTVCFRGEVNFFNNLAHSFGGGALYGSESAIHFQGNTNFINNSATGPIGGAVYLFFSSLTCEGNTTFLNNSVGLRGGGLYSIDSMVIFTGTTTFLENRAELGGGLGLEGNSSLMLQLPVLLSFDSNIATSKGGAIFVDTTSYFRQCQTTASVERSNCFFKIDSSNSSISDTLFDPAEATNLSSSEILLNTMHNEAGDAGSVLYGGSLNFCRVQVSGIQVDDSFEFFSNISNISLAEMNATVPYISSDPLRLCFCTDETITCSNRSVSDVIVHSGQQFNLSVIGVGQGDMPVPTKIRAYIQDEGSNSYLPAQNFSIPGACTNIALRLYTNDTSKTLALFSNDGPCGDTEITRLKSYVELAPCPSGFQQMGNECVCEKRLANLDSRCDIDTSKIERPGNAWLGPMFDENASYWGFILYEDCPLGFCKPENDNVSFQFLPNHSDIQCSENRTGRLCGACKKSYSLTLNNFNCKKCSNSHLSLLFFFAFSGVALIALLLALNITVGAGTMNGLILYANIVNANGLIFFPNDSDNLFWKEMMKPLRVFISWLNLDFGIETCFYDSLNFYSYAWLNYIFPFYLWFLIGAIIVCCKHFAKVGRLFGSNPIAVLATVILMSYTKLLEAIVISLSYVTLQYPNGSVRAWLYDPTLPYLKSEHAFLAMFAIFIIVFLLLPYLLLLLFGYRLQAFSKKKPFSWINRIKPLLDAYYAPYRKNSRYWPGFMLLVRSCLYLSFSFNILHNSSANLIAISSVFTAAALIPWLSHRIYEKFYNDVLEASFILNLCLLSSAT